MKLSRPAGPRPISTIARAERKGAVVCPDVLVVIPKRPAGLGVEPRDDLTAWFYGALTRDFEYALEDLADAARGGLIEPQLDVDLVLQTPGGELRLEGCLIGTPVRNAGPASTLEYRLSHPGDQRDAQLHAA